MNVFLNSDFIQFIGVKNSPFNTPLNLNKTYTVMDKYRNNIKGLRNHLKKFRVTIVDTIEPFLKSAIVSGWTYTPEMNRKDYVSVILTIHSKCGFDLCDFSDKEWNEFKCLFIQVLAHEFIHFRQAHNTKNLEFSDKELYYSRSRCDNTNTERGYHASVQEIEAYGHCLYLETLWIDCRYKDFKKRLTRTPTYIMLLEVYGGDHTCDVIKAHKKECIKWKLKYESIKS